VILFGCCFLKVSFQYNCSLLKELLVDRDVYSYFVLRGCTGRTPTSTAWRIIRQMAYITPFDVYRNISHLAYIGHLSVVTTKQSTFRPPVTLKTYHRELLVYFALLIHLRPSTRKA